MDNEILNNIKVLALDMIDNANSGHPGIVLSSAPIMYTLFANHLNINVNHPNWANRDRFVLSAGHGSALLYATLFMAGASYTIDDLKNFRRIGFKTSGHPEYDLNSCIEMTTGPLGQGIATSVGLALAGKKLNQKFHFLSDYKVYVLCGDGDLMEGVSYEALSLAGTLNLNNLIILYDSNDMSLDGRTDNVFSENIAKRFESMNFNVLTVKDGTDLYSIDKAINKAKKSNKPTLIQIKTILGKDSLNENTNLVHGTPLDKEDINTIKTKYKLIDEPFYVNENLKSEFTKKVYEHTKLKYEKWNLEYNEYVKENIFGFKDAYLNLSNLRFDEDLKEATRITNGKIMNEIAKLIPNFIGGGADVASSTKTYLDEFKDITKLDYSGSNVRFGVREHAMGAVLNGLALSDYYSFGSTFLVFSDYLKPSIRMSALMNLPVTYIFTHDSINIGPDGPTHQPVEQLVSLRSIPNLSVYRPCDAHELVGCWENIINNKQPSCLVLSRHEVNLLKSTDSKKVSYGAYVILDCENPHGTLIATGSEVQIAYNIAFNLNDKGLNLRVVSMPNRELFLKQSLEYQEYILPKGLRNIVIEAGSKLGWEGFVYSDKYLITVDQFGVSGTKDEVLKHMNFDYESILQRVLKLFK